MLLKLVKSECKYFIKSLLYFGYVLMIPVFYLLQYLPAAVVDDGVAVDPAAFARVFCDSYGTVTVFFTSFLIVLYLRKDARLKQTDPYAASSHSSFLIQSARALAMTIMLFVPVLIAAIAALLQYILSPNTGDFLSYFSFLYYPVTWLLPSLLFTVALGMFITYLTNLPLALPLQAVLWILTLGSTKEIGDYNTALAIRHTTLGGYEAFHENLTLLVLNRIVVTLLALLFFYLSVRIYQKKRSKK